MSVIVELSMPSTTFELGEILRVEDETTVMLDTMVPLGGRPTPFIRVQDNTRTEFVQHVRNHPSVNNIQKISSEDGEILYALTWDPSGGTLFERIRDMDAELLNASGDAERWTFELRFPDHGAVSEFQEWYTGQGIQVTIGRIYNPTDGDVGTWYGLTEPQRETLMVAVEKGYYSLPRQISTKQLAEEFDISDQAVTERLRRGIDTLVRNSLLSGLGDEE